MGSGIALTAAQAGIAAFQVDLSAAQLEKAPQQNTLQKPLQEQHCHLSLERS